MDIQKKYSLSGVIIIVSCFLLLTGACRDKDRIEMEVQTNNVLLDFNASTTNTVITETRGFIPVEGFTGNSYNFGLSVTKNGSETIPGSDDMTATMTKQGAEWTWAFKDKSNNPIIPRGPAGKPLKIKAYYSDASSSGNGEVVPTAFTNGIPFDFTQTGNLKQTEILYNTNSSYTIPPSAGDKATIPLQFQHAYSWISIRVTKYVEKGVAVNLSGVAIDNLSGNWIKNKGNIDVETGLAMPRAISGPIGETRTPEPLPVSSSTSFITYDFLVPAFMDEGVKDEDIAITLMINGRKEIFPLERAHLNQDGGKYGFRQGALNTYNLEFNNSSLNMRLISWKSTTINGNFGTAQSVPTNYSRIDYNTTVNNGIYWGSLQPGTFLSLGTRLYDNYLTTVSYGGNGAYVSANPKQVNTDQYIYDDDENVRTAEGVYSLFEMTTEDISVELEPWEDENGQLVAKEICRQYNGGGNHDWRLPRASELRTLFLCLIYNSGRSEFLNLRFNDSSGNQEKLYWTGTEVDKNNAWAMYYYNKEGNHRGPMISTQDKRTKLSVRCVRNVK